MFTTLGHNEIWTYYSSTINCLSILHKLYHLWGWLTYAASLVRMENKFLFEKEIRMNLKYLWENNNFCQVISSNMYLGINVSQTIFHLTNSWYKDWKLSCKAFAKVIQPRNLFVHDKNTLAYIIDFKSEIGR